jgi:hypothetical protein
LFDNFEHQDQMKKQRTARLATGFAVSLVSYAAVAQDAPSLPPRVPSVTPTPEMLEQQIRDRDAIINKLSRRLDALEKEVRQPARRAAAAPSAPVPLRETEPVQSTQAQPPQPSPPQPPLLTATRPVSSPPNEETDANIVRALENTLVDQGGLLLSPWSMQIVPDFSYSHQSLDQLSFVSPNLLPPGVGNPVTQKATRDLLEWGLGFRLGLPWDSQISIRLPFDLDYGSATFAGASGVSQNRGGVGDFSMTFQKQVLHEKGPIPDVLLSLTYKANTGSTSFATRQVSTFPFATGTGSGFNALTGGVTLLKRQDPLVFLGAIAYTHNFASTINGISQTPGDAVFTRVAAILAASPDTSLRIGWNTTWQQDAAVRGTSIPGTNQQISFMEFGVGSVLSARWFLDAAVDIGLTRDSPDYEFLISFPYRF